jgi:hypothetical protein
MTNPFGDGSDWNTGPVEYFDNNAASNHLLIFLAQDAPEYFRTTNNPDGMVHPTRGATWSPFPNTVVRGAVADLTMNGADGLPGKVYAGAVVFPSSLVRIMKGWVTTPTPRLLMWRKTGPKQTDPYEVVNMAGDQNAVAVASEFLARHPEFLTTPAPEPYNGQPPAPQPPQWQGSPQGYVDPQQPYYPPQGPPQGYGQPQPNYGQPQGFQPDPWAQPQRSPQAPPQQGGSFLDQYNQHPPRQPQERNHWGQVQDGPPPF